MARPITDELSGAFTTNARARGIEYFLAGRVRLLDVKDDGVPAVVSGSLPYNVWIGLDDRPDGTTVDVRCDCPYFLDRSTPCKHIWATLLAAGSEKRLGPFHPPVQLLADGDTPQPPELSGAYRAAPRPLAPRVPPRPPDPGQQLLATLEAHVKMLAASPPPVFRYAGSELMYVFVLDASPSNTSIHVHVLARSRKKSGEWTKPKLAKLSRVDVISAPDVDRPILSSLFGGVRETRYYSDDIYTSMDHEAMFGMPEAIAPQLVPAIAKTGRAFVRRERRAPLPVARLGFPSPVALPIVEHLAVRWDDGEPWRFVPVVTRTDTGWRLDGKLVRRDDGSEWVALGDVLGAAFGFVWTRATVARAELGMAGPLVAALAKRGAIEIKVDDSSRLAAALGELAVTGEALPEELRIERVDVPPTPRLHLASTAYRPDLLAADVSFGYGDSIVPQSASSTYFDAARRRLIARRTDAELAALNRLAGLGLRRHFDPYSRDARLQLPSRELPGVVSTLIREGWHVEAEGSAFRPAGRVQLSVSSGIDWFDLHATVEFGDTTASLTEVLAALERRQTTVRLGDGTIGILPETWLERYLPLAAAGEVQNGHIRFRSPQAALLDALLADAAEHASVDVDAGFTRARDELARLGSIAPVDPPSGFVGVLRDYQRDGLGWLQFLERSGFGGCLADDMGLGKTIMVLALLLGRRDRAGAGHRPSLVIVPRSLVHNWMSEAARFTPALRVVDFSTTARPKDGLDFSDADVVLATYGTLRQDVLQLRDVLFDYVILDESQAIKNEKTASAKAVRLLRGDHRLALTGTPIENHLGELWSLFEFLNPGVLGRSSIFKRAASAAPDPHAVRLLARGLRPFMLRRTKQQVARELPEKTEQTITCELSRPERTLYDSLRKHYRSSVLARVERDGIKRSQMHILEALLRLRQAACHPALVDRTKPYASSAKLDVVLAQAKEVIEEGHKAIVFSQFTSLLALLRAQLDKDGIVYEYLDGQTRQRADHVRRFQEDPSCRLFLVSLKAGGVGLNLTAAEYVFLLDPWWNPAVESQAIDRAHRIGQTREVFAYRLVAGNTIESKILELQATKRALADAVLGGGAGGLKSLDRADLELLLS